MGQRRYRTPSTSALVALESVVRLGGFGRAAEELNTSQSAVSRHIKHLEESLGTLLLRRKGRSIELTRAGAIYHGAVLSALEAVDAAEKTLRALGEEVTIACTHEVSHLLLMPHYDRLRRRLGDGVQIRIMTTEYETLDAMIDAGADLTFAYSKATPKGPDQVAVLPEEITPICSPGFHTEHRGVLRGSPATWQDLPLLDLSKPNHGWATWSDWFQASGGARPTATVETFDNYVYLLEASAAGKGLALGWRGFVDRYLEAGTLVPAVEPWYARATGLYARLTPKGARNEAARRCLDFLSGLYGA